MQEKGRQESKKKKTTSCEAIVEAQSKWKFSLKKQYLSIRHVNIYLYIDIMVPTSK